MFYDNFSRLSTERGKSPTSVAKELVFSNAAASHWKNGKSHTAKTLQKIADYFGVTVNDLLTDTPAPSKLHREEGEKIAVLASVGEFLALTPDDIQDGFITVRHSKTKAGRRRIPIAARTALFWQERVAVGISYIVPLAVQNDTPDARYMTFKRAFIDRFAALGLPDHLPHDTRHTTATLLHAAGVDPYVVKRILGHATQDVTEKIYTHISDEMLREAIDRI